MEKAVSVGSTATMAKAYEALAKRDVQTARAALDEAKGSWPDNAPLLLLEARVVEAEGSAVAAKGLYKKAADALAALLAQAPNGNRAVALANALCKCGELDAARTALAEAARLGAPEDQILRAKRDVAFAGNDLAARRRAAEAVVGLADRGGAWDWAQLAIVCWDLADRNAAAAAAARALELDPGNVKAARIASWAAKAESASFQGPAEWIAKSRQALGRRDVPGARAALEKAKRSWPDDPEVLMLEARVVEAGGSPVAAKGLYEKAADALAVRLALRPDGNRAVALANALCKCGKFDAARTALAEATRLGAPRLYILRAERALAFACGDLPAMRQAAEAILEAGDRVDAWDWVNLSIACRGLDDIAAAAAAAARAMELDPINPEAAEISAWLALRQGNGESAIQELRRAAALSPNNARLAFQLVRTFSLSGRSSEAGDELDRALERWPNNSSLRAFALTIGLRTIDQLPDNEEARSARDVSSFREAEIRRLALALPSNDALLRPAIVNDLSKDVIVGRADRSDRLVLVFTGPHDTVNMPIAMFDRYLAALGVNAIYLKDFNRSFYLQGVVSLGGSLEATMSALRGLIDRMGARHVYCIGASAGGFAAIRYGAELAVEKVMSFAGQTYDPPRELSKLELGLALILRRRAEFFSSEATDLAPFVRSRRSRTRFELFYPEGAPRDSAQAKHMEGIEGVTLHPVAGCDDHELLKWIALREDLGALLATLLGAH